jgi:hypothetical protein
VASRDSERGGGQPLKPRKRRLTKAEDVKFVADVKLDASQIQDRRVPKPAGPKGRQVPKGRRIVPPTEQRALNAERRLNAVREQDYRRTQAGSRGNGPAKLPPPPKRGTR